MEKLEIFRTIIDIVAVIIAGGWLVRAFTFKSRVKQGKAEADITVEEAKEKQVDNIKKIVDEIYKPAIDDLKQMVNDLRDSVKSVEDENESLKKEIAEIKEENGRLKKENEELRVALREIRPDVVPSKRSVNAKNQARGDRGQFVKKEE